MGTFKFVNLVLQSLFVLPMGGGIVLSQSCKPPPFPIKFVNFLFSVVWICFTSSTNSAKIFFLHLHFSYIFFITKGGWRSTKIIYLKYHRNYEYLQKAINSIIVLVVEVYFQFERVISLWNSLFPFPYFRNILTFFYHFTPSIHFAYSRCKHSQSEWYWQREHVCANILAETKFVSI